MVSNADDEVGRELAMQTKKAITYGIYYPSDVFAINLNKTQDGNSFVINLFDWDQHETEMPPTVCLTLSRGGG